MNPVVLISTHLRREITTANIRTLQAQSVVPEIVLVVSDPQESHYYTKLGVKVIIAANKPLGSKWQNGVDFARKLKPSHLIITGSDDILYKGFIEKYCTEDYFTGLQRWYIYSKGVLYLLDYLAKQCLGGGRVYSRALLDAYDWQVFDRKADKLLDDKGYEMTRPNGRKIITDTGCILAVKGSWVVMNPLSLRHPNVRLVQQWDAEEAKQIIKEKFGYEY